MSVGVSCGWDHPGGWMVTSRSPEQLVRHYLEVKYVAKMLTYFMKWTD